MNWFIYNKSLAVYVFVRGRWQDVIGGAQVVPTVGNMLQFHAYVVHFEDPGDK